VSVCRSFRDFGKHISNRQFCHLEKCFGSQLVAVVKEENTLLAEHLLAGMDSTEGAENNWTCAGLTSLRDQLTLILCRGLVNFICS
jgi:hypothetical protein